MAGLHHDALESFERATSLALDPSYREIAAQAKALLDLLGENGEFRELLGSGE